jgi:hypothetical protein
MILAIISHELFIAFWYRSKDVLSLVRNQSRAKLIILLLAHVVEFYFNFPQLSMNTHIHIYI